MVTNRREWSHSYAKTYTFSMNTQVQKTASVISLMHVIHICNTVLWIFAELSIGFDTVYITW